MQADPGSSTDPSLRRLQVPALVLLLGLLATALVVVQLWRLTEAKDRERFENGVMRRQAAIEERLNVHIALLRGVAGLLASDPNLTRSQFRDYVGRLEVEQTYPGLQGIGFSLRVAHEDVEAVEAMAQQQGLTDFRIKPAGPRPEYHTILYLLPEDDANQAAVGYDMSTEATRQRAMEKARNSGNATLSGKVELVQEIDPDDKQAGFVIYVPVYEGGGIPPTPDERSASLIGFAYSPFRADDLFTGFLRAELRPTIALEIYDGAFVEPEALLHRSVKQQPQRRQKPLYTATEQLRIADHVWTIHYQTLPDFRRVSGRGLVPLTAGTGSLVSLLLAGVAWRQARAREVAELHRVTSVAAAHRLRVALTNAPVSVYTCDRDLRYTWIQGRIASFSAAQLLGRRDDELFGEQEASELMAFKRNALADGRVSRREMRLGVGGATIIFDLTAEPLRDRTGRVTGLTVAMVDLTQRVLAEDRAREEGETLTILNRLGTSLASKLDLEELVQSATDAATMLTGARFGAFFYNVPDDRGQPFRLYTVSGVPREQFARFPMPRDREVLSRTFSGTGIVRSDDITADSRYGIAPADGQPEGQLRVRSYLAVPVVARTGEVLGGLFFGHPEAGIFSERDERITAGIAAQAAIGIDNARLYEAEARAVRRLQESEERLHLAVAIAELGTFDIDLETDYVTVNETGREIYGWPAGQQLTFTAVQAQFHPEDRERVMEQVKQALAPGGPGEFEVEQRIIRNDGQERWLRVRGQAVFEQEGSAPRRCVGIYRDVTEDRQAEQLRERTLAAERAAREEAEHVGRLKDEFLATLSHELRTPLNAILGWASILREGNFTPDEVQEGVEVIERNARAQAQLIEDLLDVSRIISGKLRINVQPVDLPPVLDAALAAIQPAAEAREIRLERSVDPEPGLVSGDPARLQQIFWNLISNAIKFTPEGGKVQVRLERVNAHIEVTVTDTGQGIRPEFLPHLFERFRQADATTTRQHGGLGLGLSIVKQLAEIHGGSVRAASEGIGQGASFVVSLPVSMPHLPAVRDDAGAGTSARSASKGRRLCDHGALHGLHVLVVDDERDSRELVGHVLSRCGADVTTAGSVDEAMTRIASQTPQILIGDIGMPGRDGYELIAEVRKRGLGAQHLPAIALTAFARPQDREKALDAGYQVHVAKPVDAGELVAIVAGLTGRSNGPLEALPRSAKAPARAD